MSGFPTNFWVFFKVRDAVKKAEVKTDEIKTLDDLLQLFFERFETLKYSSINTTSRNNTHKF
jgi:hypothetical protein